MNESERIQRLKQNRNLEYQETDQIDEEFSARILALLNHPQIDKYCMVDAYYYDFSVIPHYIQESLNLWRDCYMIFGITKEGEIVSKWVDRWDLDSDDPVVDGRVIHSEKKGNESNFIVPEIRQYLDPELLCNPYPDFLKNFKEFS